MVGVVDRVIKRFRNFCDSLSATDGGVGILGRFRSDEYDGGVMLEPSAPYDVEGRSSEAGVEARRLEDEAHSRGAGEPRRDRDESSSLSLLVRSSCSNRKRKSCAHSSP